MKRKLIAMLLAGALLLLVGCVYEVPLVQEHTIAVDPSVLGLWEYGAEEGEQVGAPERMLVLRYSDTEYLIHYPMGKGGMYFRGYPIRIEDISCVQLQLLGSEEGPAGGQEKKLFHVASYQLVNDRLLLTTLNTELVDDDLPGSSSLREAFIKNKDNPALFENPGSFKRIQENENPVRVD